MITPEERDKARLIAKTHYVVPNSLALRLLDALDEAESNLALCQSAKRHALEHDDQTQAALDATIEGNQTLRAELAAERERSERLRVELEDVYYQFLADVEPGRRDWRGRMAADVRAVLADQPAKEPT